MSKKILIFSFFIIPFVIKAQQPLEIRWEDLVPAIKYDDPFKKLSDYQLADLRYVARIRNLEAENKEQVTIELSRKKDSLELVLARQGVDIDYLLSIRQKITELRKKEAESTNNIYDGKQVLISGYLLPLDYDGDVSRKFLLVPWVGACIHTPPPPKNQIIYLEINSGYKVTSRFEAVKIEGKMTIEEKVSDLFLIDGTDKIATGYSINARQVTGLKQ